MSIQNYKDFDKENANYAEHSFGSKGELPIPPGKKLAVGTLTVAMLENQF